MNILYLSGDPHAGGEGRINNWLKDWCNSQGFERYLGFFCICCVMG